MTFICDHADKCIALPLYECLNPERVCPGTAIYEAFTYDDGEHTINDSDGTAWLTLKDDFDAETGRALALLMSTHEW